MEYERFKSELKRAEVSVKELALLLMMNPNSITNYRQRREVPRHLAVIAVMIAELSAHGVELEAIERVLD